MHLIETGLIVTLAVLLGALGWAAFVYLRPYRQCRWCRVFAWFQLRCRRCNGQKLTRRLGAKHVHKVKLSLAQAWAERSWS